MSPRPPPSDDDLDARYRRASEADPVAPRADVRAAIHAEAARVAAAVRAAAIDAQRPAANDGSWKIAAFGTAAVVVLAVFVAMPLLHDSQRRPPTEARVAAEAPPSTTSIAARERALEAPPGEPIEPARPPVPSASDRRLEEGALKKAEGPTDLPMPAALAPPVAPAPAAVAGEPALTAPQAPAAALAARREAGDSRNQAAAADATAGAPTARAQAVPASKAGASDAGVEALCEAAAAGDRERVERLIAAGASPSMLDADGRSPLVLATVNDRLEVVRALIAHGADPRLADRAGRTPLGEARARHLDAIEAALLGAAGPR